MNRAYDPKRVINGTYGEIWLGGDELNEVTALEARVSFEKQDVIQCGQFISGTKIVGAKGSGTVKMHKVTSYMTSKLLGYLKKGQFPSLTIVSNLDDPDAYGAERVKLTGVTFDEMTVADWEAQKPGEQSYPFTFTGVELIDRIKKK